MIVLAIVVAYLGVGLCCARVRNNRYYDNNGTGVYADGHSRMREPRDATFVLTVQGVALTLTWPFVAAGLLIAGFFIGLSKVAYQIYVPDKLKSLDRGGS